MNIHRCVFKILGKKQSVADGHTGPHTDRRADVKNSIPHHKVCGGINRICTHLIPLSSAKLTWISGFPEISNKLTVDAIRLVTETSTSRLDPTSSTYNSKHKRNKIIPEGQGGPVLHT